MEEPLHRTCFDRRTILKAAAGGAFLLLSRKAIDFRIPKASLQSLREAALRRQEGGGGYYPGSGFVHIDSGRFRAW